MRAAAARALHEVRRACLALPETSERLSHGAPTFFAGKKTFVMFVDDHHGDGRLAIWCAAPEGAATALAGAEPAIFFRPPYVGTRGWVGVRLDVRPDAGRLAVLIEDAYRTVATRKLLVLLDVMPPAAPPPKTRRPAARGRRP